MPDNIFLILAAIFFGLGAFNVPKYNWISAGLCCVTLGLLLGV